MQLHVPTCGPHEIQECDPSPAMQQLIRCESASATCWTDRSLQAVLGIQSSFTEDTTAVNALENRNAPVPKMLR